MTDAWDLDDDGMITLHPLTAYTTALLAETVCGLRLQFSSSADQIETGWESVQLALTPEQAVALAEALARTAALAVQGPAPDDTAH